MSINSKLEECINNTLEFKGVNLDLADNFNKGFFNLNEEQATDNVRVSVGCDHFDERMFLTVLKDMLKDGEVEINFTEKATQKHKDYLDKLMEEKPPCKEVAKTEATD